MIVECARDQCTVTFEEFHGAHRRRKYCSDECKKRRAKDPAKAKLRDEHKLTFYGVDGEGENRAMRYRTDDIEHPIEEDFDRWNRFDDDVAWDEYLVDKYQDYVMLSVGDNTLTKNGGERLTYEDIFPFLYDRFLEIPETERKYSVFVGFRLQYDFTMTLRDIHKDTAIRLFSKQGIEARRVILDSGASIQHPVYVIMQHGVSRKAEWEVDFLGMKRMKLRPHVPKSNWPECTVNHKTKESIEKHYANECRRNHPYQWMFICDASPYFQGSFMSVIDPGNWGNVPIVSNEEWAILEAGKLNRNAAKFGPEMERYNVMENGILARVLNRMNEGLVAMGVRVPKDKWYGPGAAAQLWLKANNMPTRDLIEQHVPSWALDVGQKCYYGGRFENSIHGTVPGKIWNYDITSAYPYAQSEAPCWLHGKWSRGEGKPPKLSTDTLRMIKVDIKGRNKWLGAVPYRGPSGAVLFPRCLTGWYWQHEIDAGIEAKLIHSYKVHEWVDYKKCGCPPPFAAINDAFDERQRVGGSSPHGKALKLIINSLYGKSAQSIGIPAYACSLYASYITSRCRTQILQAIATHPMGAKAVAKIATDGIYFTSPHQSLPCVPKDVNGKKLADPKLGEWEEDIYVNMSFFLPGVDWDDKTRNKLENEGSSKVGASIRSRGISAAKLADNIHKIDPQWEALKDWLRAQTEREWPTSFLPNLPTYTVDLGWGYTSPKLAVSQGKWERCGVSQFHEKRDLNSSMVTKREYVYLDNTKNMIRSTPYVERGETTYYDKTFGRVVDNEEDLFVQLEDYVLPDGSLAELFGESLKD